MFLSPYLMFKGNCQEAFKFYHSVLGGDILAMMTAKGSPMEAHCPPDQLNNIMHARLKFGDSILMGSDTPAEHFKPMAGFTVTLETETAEESERLFKALSQGGTVQMELQPTFWSVRFGTFTDRFGTPWMINCAQMPG